MGGGAGIPRPGSAMGLPRPGSAMGGESRLLPPKEVAEHEKEDEKRTFLKRGDGAAVRGRVRRGSSSSGGVAPGGRGAGVEGI